MTRAEDYAEGFAHGRLWAEADIRAHSRDWADTFRSDARSTVSDGLRAFYLGAARGYRDALARYDAGTLTREMFELAPRSPR